MSRSPEARADRGGSARWPLLAATALLSPLLFLALLEGLLALVGFPAAEPLFVAVPERPERLHANPEVMRRFFPGGAPKVAPESIEFAAHKPEGTLRIVVQGGSSAAGFPYGRFAGLAGMLGERLEAAFPAREIEVISTAMAAVNSFALLDFSEEILAIQPDAVLVYAGHNEYMGVLGVGSGLTARRSLAATRLHLALGRYRVYRYLQALVARARGGLLAPDGEPAEGRAAAGRHLMARAAEGSEVAYGSEVYRQGVAQLEANLDDLLGRYAEAGVPVYLGTLVGNEKDRPPFASAQGSDGADAWFARGRAALARGDGEEALHAFREARDRDRLPFRAPSALQEVIRAAAARHGAVLVDVQARFAAASPHGIVGDELLLEHVHPNPEGYFLLADTYLRALRQEGFLGAPEAERSLEDARREMPITRFDRTLGRYAVAELEASVPFVASPRPPTLPQPGDPVERLAWSYHHGRLGWLEAMEALMQLQRSAGRIREAAVVARMAAQAFPGERATQYTAAMLYLELGRLERARRYLRRSLLVAPDDPAARRALERIARRIGDAAQPPGVAPGPGTSPSTVGGRDTLPR